LARKSSGVGLSLIVDLQLSVIWVNVAPHRPVAQYGLAIIA
jgi:hypothetical protein